ncbi:MAG TPA: twin-arginine translocation signal domain-containing protein, partial [Acidobacteriaceae bacterium]|nr:twin-arginine translocation signal domain-containing protein [Acidobacteriaceae bacterium]
MHKASLSRREFLQTSAGVAGASLIAGSTFLESESFASAAQTTAPG